MNKKLSVILLSYFSGERLITATEKLVTLLSAHQIPFEIIIVDDGSTDDSFEIACSLENKYDQVIARQLSRNYTSHYAIFAGLSLCSGSCAVPMPDDEQQPYETIVAMYRLWEQGNKVIIPYRIGRNDPIVSKYWALFFYKAMNRLSEIKFPQYGADLFFIDREVIDILNHRIHPTRTTVITEVLRLGFSPLFYPYTRPLGSNRKSRWSFKKKVNLAKDFFFSSSTFPITLIFRLGLFFSMFSLLLIAFYLFIVWAGPDHWVASVRSVPGWTSTIVIIAFFSGLILFSLGIIAEYIWRIYEEVKGRPGYIIKSKKTN